jgi:putative membrane fusion protein
VFISFVIYLIDNWKTNQNTYIVYQDTIENKLEVEVALVKKEKIIFSNADGSAVFFKNHGEKVKSGILIAQQYNDDHSKSLSDEIKMIDEMIEIKQGIKNANHSVGSARYDAIELEIQQSLLNSDYSNVLLLIESVNSSEFNDKYYAYEMYTVEELINLKNSLNKNILSDKVSYYSPSGGLVSYQFDGLENIYSFERIDQINLNDARKFDLKTENTVDAKLKPENPLYKIVDNFEWYLVGDIPSEHYDILSTKKYIKIRLNKIDKTIYVEPYRLQKYGERLLVVFKADRFLYQYLDDRYIQIDIILEEFSGLKIQRGSIMKLDGVTGVYVADANKIVKFRPINIVGENEACVVVEEGNKLNVGSRGTIIIGEKNYSTIMTYDSVVLDPENVYEGQILR